VYPAAQVHGSQQVTTPKTGFTTRGALGFTVSTKRKKLVILLQVLTKIKFSGQAQTFFLALHYLTLTAP